MAGGPVFLALFVAVCLFLIAAFGSRRRKRVYGELRRSTATLPTSPTQQAAELLRAGDFLAAEAAYAKLYSARSGAGGTAEAIGEAAHGLGLAQMHSGKFGEAEEHLQVAIANGARRRASLAALADIQEKLGERAEAERIRGLASHLPPDRDAPGEKGIEGWRAIESILTESTDEVTWRTQQLIQHLQFEVFPYRSASLSHLARCLGAILAGLAAAALGIVPRQASGFVALAFVLVGMYNGYLAWVTNTSRYEIRDGMIRWHRGGFSRDTKVLEIFRVSAFEVKRTFLNRLTGDGSIIATPDNEPGHEEIKLIGIAKKKDLQDLLMELRALNRLLRTDARIKGIIR